jgi:hypothetical protein
MSSFISVRCQFLPGFIVDHWLFDQCKPNAYHPRSKPNAYHPRIIDFIFSNWKSFIEIFLLKYLNCVIFKTAVTLQTFMVISYHKKILPIKLSFRFFYSLLQVQ